MPICSKCRTGFDADLSRCPKCNTAWVAERRRFRYYKSLILSYFWRLFFLAIVLWIVYQIGWNYLKYKQDSLIAFDTRTGQVVWSVPLGGRNSVVRFINAEQGRVFAGVAVEPNEFGIGEYREYKRYKLQAFDGFSGKRLWTFSPQLSEPYRAREMAFNFSPYVRGETLWMNVLVERSPKQPKVASNPLNTKKQQNTSLPNIRNGQVIALNAATGQQKWAIDRDWNIDFPNHIGIASHKDQTVILRITPKQTIWLETVHTLTGKRIWQVQIPSKKEKYPSNLYRRYQLIASSSTMLLLNRATNTIDGYAWDTGKLKFQIKSESSSEKTAFSDPTYKYDRQIAFSDSALYKYDRQFDVGTQSYIQTVEAFDTNTGVRRWAVNVSNATNSKCAYLQNFETVIDGVYGTCLTNDLRIALLFLDATTGSDRLSKQILGAKWLEHFSTNRESIFAFVDRSHWLTKLVALARGGDRQLWEWTPKYPVLESSLTTEGDRIFVLGNVPRWRRLTGRLS
jgi:outer membrane protein assembly factor BamB